MKVNSILKKWNSDTAGIVKVVSLIWCVISFMGGGYFVDSHYQEGISNATGYVLSRPLQYICFGIAYIVSVCLIFAICKFLYNALAMDGKERKIFFYMLPVLIVLASYLLTDISWTDIQNYYVGDEKNIWDAAVRMYPFFFVYSSELFLICFLLFPSIIAPSIFKIIFVAYVFGYTIYRTKMYYKTNWAYSLYAVFALKPFLELGIRVHRMHWYAMLYLLVAIKLYYDCKLKVQFEGRKLIGVSIILSILTIWRREGCYLIIWGLLLLLFTYIDWEDIKNSKQPLCSKGVRNIKYITALFFLTEILICLPEFIFEININKANESAWTYQAYIVHMLGEKSFDRSACGEELAIINKFLDLETIDRYNSECLLECYQDTYWGRANWGEGQYYAVKSYFTPENMEEFNNAVMKVIMKEPGVFLKSRISAFMAAARARNSYNLFLPFLLLLMILIFGIRGKDKVLILLSLGMVGHMAITVLTMPASYFKYFFQMYAFGWVFAVIVVMEKICSAQNISRIKA